MTRTRLDYTSSASKAASNEGRIRLAVEAMHGELTKLRSENKELKEVKESLEVGKAGSDERGKEVLEMFNTLTLENSELVARHDSALADLSVATKDAAEVTGGVDALAAAAASDDGSCCLLR